MDIKRYQKYVARCATVALRCWLILAIIFNQYLCVVLLYYLFFRKIARYYFGFFATGLGQTYVLFKIIKERKKIRSTFMDLLQWFQSENPRQYRRFIRNVKLAFYFLAMYCFMVGLLGVAQATYMIQSQNVTYTETIARLLCFDCDLTLYPKWLPDLALYLDLILYPLTVFTFFLLVSVPYCVVCRVIYHIIHEIHELVRLDSAIGQLHVLRWKMLKIYRLTTGVNDVFERVILLWFAVTLCCCCERAVLFVEIVYNAWSNWCTVLFYMVMSFQDVIHLALVIMTASSVKEVSRLCYVSATRLIDPCVAGGNLMEVQLLLAQLKANKIELRAGSCFTITSNLLLSFMGLILTYSVVYLQFSPNVLSAMQQ